MLNKIAQFQKLQSRVIQSQRKLSRQHPKKLQSKKLLNLSQCPPSLRLQPSHKSLNKLLVLLLISSIMRLEMNKLTLMKRELLSQKHLLIKMILRICQSSIPLLLSHQLKIKTQNKSRNLKSRYSIIWMLSRINLKNLSRK